MYFPVGVSLADPPTPLSLRTASEEPSNISKSRGAEPGHWVSGKIISINKYHKTPLEGKALKWGG